MKAINKDDTFLFDKVIVGPIKSRRLGNSLGINLLPTLSKVCNFDCNYCECGWNKHTSKKPDFASLTTILNELHKKIELMKVDSITFAGNGEPTLHPKFHQIVIEIVNFRNEHFPKSKISVLTNGTQLHKPSIIKALKKIDVVQIKLDAGLESTFTRINSPNSGFTIEKLIKNLHTIDFDFEIQTMFVDGSFEGYPTGNVSEIEIRKWLKIIYEIQPKKVHIYSIDREVPLKCLEKVDSKQLRDIANKVNKLGIHAEYYGEEL